MSKRAYISPRLRKQLVERARQRCSYCRSSEAGGVPMAIDHVIPLVAGGMTDVNNLTLACYRCNEFKGGRTTAIDPQTGEPVPLFNPCLQDWHKHFCWSEDGLTIIGQTAIGRATLVALRLNDEWLIRARRIWRTAGIHPPLE